jgi:hypothetical protein
VRLMAILALAGALAACSASPLRVLNDGSAGAEAGGSTDSAGSDLGSCTIVLASDYDQSCLTDADCVSVGQQPECPVVDCLGCIPGAINTSAMVEYMTALSHAGTREPPAGPVCSCPCETGFALCRGGKCQAAPCGPPPSDTLAACANAGGVCGYITNIICHQMGPPDACAYSDELCCLN